MESKSTTKKTTTKRSTTSRAKKGTTKATAKKKTAKAKVTEIKAPPKPTEAAAVDQTEQLDLESTSANDFIMAYEGHVAKLTEVLWDSVLEANKEGVFVNRNVAASAFAELMLRICVAQAKSIEGGVERFKEVLEL